jgi:tetratricopeptide (TPR) repeat protein
VIKLLKGKTQPIIIAIVLFILVLPLAFLVFKTAPVWSGKKTSPRLTIRQLEDAAKSAPSFGNYLNLSVAYINSHQPEKSLAPLEMAKKINPRSAVVYNNFGVAYLLLKRYDEGIAACRKAIELDPSFQLAKNNLNWGLAEKEKLRSR